MTLHYISYLHGTVLHGRRHGKKNNMRKLLIISILFISLKGYSQTFTITGSASATVKTSDTIAMLAPYTRNPALSKNAARDSFVLTFDGKRLTAKDSSGNGLPTIPNRTYLANVSGTTSLPISANISIYNVMDYGAVHDSVTDDRASIIAALAALPSSGGVLFFPAGIYYVSDSIIIPFNVRIMGVSSGGVFFDPAQASTSTVIMSKSATNSVFILGPKGSGQHAGVANVIENIAIVNRASSIPTNGAGIRVYDGGTFMIRNVSIRGFWIDADMVAGQMYRIIDCDFFAPVKYGLNINNNLNGDAGDMIVTGCNFLAGTINATSYGLHWTASGGLKLSNSKFNSADATKSHQFIHGIFFEQTAATSDIQITNVSIESFDSSGIMGRFGPLQIHNFQLNNIQIAGFGAFGSGINLSSSGFASLLVLNNVTLWATPAQSTLPAIQLTNLDNVAVSQIVSTGFLQSVAYTNCTNIITPLLNGANVASAATITPTGNQFHVTGTTTITSIAAGTMAAGTTIKIIFDGALTLTDGGNLKLAGNFTTSTDATITLTYDGTNFYEMSRSTN